MLITKRYWDDQIKNFQKGRQFCTYGRDEICMQKTTYGHYMYEILLGIRITLKLQLFRQQPWHLKGGNVERRDNY